MTRPLPPVQHERGYVLLLTLILLAMIAAGLAAVARRSVQASLDATRLERESQKRWLAQSAEDILPFVDAMLREREAEAKQYENAGATKPSKLLTMASIGQEPSGVIKQAFDLGHHRVVLTLADEQSKANLNTLWERDGPETFRGRWPAWCASVGYAGIHRPRAISGFETTAINAASEWPVFVCFEQLYGSPDTHRMALAEGDRTQIQLSNPLDYFTLWGNGGLRAARAGKPALHAALSPLLSDEQIDELAQLGTAGVAKMDLSDRQRKLLPDRLSDTSQAFSVRLTLDDGRRSTSRLVIHPNLTPSSPSSEAVAVAVAVAGEASNHRDPLLDRSQLIRFDW